MKRNKKYQLQLALSACLLMPAANAALADEKTEAPDTSNWACKFCKADYGWFGDMYFGLIYADDPTARFSDFRGIDEDGVDGDAGGQGGYRGEEGHFVDFYAANLVQDSRIVDIEAGKQGVYDMYAKYQEIPRYMGNDTVTPYAGVGTDVLTLPAGWSAGPNAPMMDADLESERTVSGAGFRFKAFKNWSADVDFERQERDGTKAFSGGVFFLNAGHFPSPVSYTTDRFDAGIEFNSRMLQLRAEFTSADFENDFQSVTWDNALALGFGDEVSRTALEPDNEYTMYSLAAALRLTDWLRFSGKFSSGEIEQDDPFLPYSVNDQFSDRTLPRESLDGKLETEMYNMSGRVYVKLAKGLDLTASYKSTERDNKTPIDMYEPVVFEMYPRGPRSNRPYSYDREQSNVELRWRPVYNMRVSGGVRNDEMERTYQEVRDTDEDSWFAEVQWAPFAVLDTRVKFDQLERDASESVQQGNFDRAENPLMRKYNMANRDRDRVTVELDLMPTDSMSIAFSYYETDDTYTESAVGLTDAEETATSVDLSYLFKNGTSLYAFFTDESIESGMSVADGVNATPWIGSTQDDIQSWGFGLSGQFNDKWSYGFDYVSSQSDGEILTHAGDVVAPFPVLKTDFENLRLHVDYQVNERWGLGLEFFNEDYSTSDWTMDGLGPFDIDGVMTLGGESPDYDVSVVRLLAKFRL
jgi:MtrB/PioB family decaheme-associated outer membrane protein